MTPDDVIVKLPPGSMAYRIAKRLTGGSSVALAVLLASACQAPPSGESGGLCAEYVDASSSQAVDFVRNASSDRVYLPFPCQLSAYPRLYAGDQQLDLMLETGSFSCESYQSSPIEGCSTACPDNV